MAKAKIKMGQLKPNVYQAMSVAREAKWEVREERLVEQLAEAKEWLKLLQTEVIEQQARK